MSRTDIIVVSGVGVTFAQGQPRVIVNPEDGTPEVEPVSNVPVERCATYYTTENSYVKTDIEAKDEIQDFYTNLGISAIVTAATYISNVYHDFGAGPVAITVLQWESSLTASQEQLLKDNLQGGGEVLEFSDVCPLIEPDFFDNPTITGDVTYDLGTNNVLFQYEYTIDKNFTQDDLNNAPVTLTLEFDDAQTGQIKFQNGVKTNLSAPLWVFNNITIDSYGTGFVNFSLPNAEILSNAPTATEFTWYALIQDPNLNAINVNGVYTI